MSTLHEYFQNDFKDLSIDTGVSIDYEKLNTITQEKANFKVEVQLRLQHSMLSSARLFTFYIPDSQDTLYVCELLLNELDKYRKQLDGIEAIGGFNGDIAVGKHQFIYSNRVFLYTETMLSKDEIAKLDLVAKSKSLYATLRSKDYLAKKAESEKPFAFISHDSRDKDFIARPLAEGLNSRLCFTWYDEFSLKVGNSLRESIEKGIKEAKMCILILTPNYLSNPGWTKKEFNSIFTRELIKNEKVVIPIWYGVTKNDIYEYSPSLTDTVALKWPIAENKTLDEFKQEKEKLISKIHTELTR